MIEIFQRSSSGDGPHLLILGAIHGNEPCGSLALRGVLKDIDEGRLPLQRGRLTLVPVCNPRALAADKRFCEENLNRVIFRTPAGAVAPLSYERQLAQELCPLIEACDYLLDLHSMEAQGQAFSMLNRFDPASLDFCLSLGAETLVEGWPEVFQNHPEVLSQCTQTYADRFHKPNALIECGSHRDPGAVGVARVAILSALKFLDLVATEALHAQGLPRQLRSSQRLKLREVIFRESPEDTFAQTWKNFDRLRRGEKIAERAQGAAVLAPYDALIVFPNAKSPVGVEWFFLASPV